MGYDSKSFVKKINYIIKKNGKCILNIIKKVLKIYKYFQEKVMGEYHISNMMN